MMNFFVENFWTITLVAGGFYLLVSIVEKIVTKRKMKKYTSKLDEKNESVEIV